MHRREHRLAIYVCLLAISLCFLQGIERYQAREIQAFIEEAEQRQGDAAWMLYRAAERRQTRMSRWQISNQTFAPAAADHIAKDLVVQTDLRAAAGPSFLQQKPFPALQYAEFPVSRVPNWGAMRTPAEWDRPYNQIPQSAFVPLPSYSLQTLQIPLESLVNPLRDASIPALTAKLTYSTRYYGAYDLDAGEYSGLHPAIDVKLAFGTPVGAIAGGRVHLVAKNEEGLGLYVIIEHRLENGEKIFSIYGHLDTARVQEGEDMEPGQIIGTVGLSGRTTAPHLHLQIDRDDGSQPHQVYWPSSIPTSVEADRHTLHPIRFVRQYALRTRE